MKCAEFKNVYMKNVTARDDNDDNGDLESLMCW